MYKISPIIISMLTIFSQIDKIQLHSCNELVCGSVVSKCLILQSCQCKLTDCFCCKDCLTCLGDLFSECCNCLDMCPERNETLHALTPKSQIADFDGIPELFDTLTSVDDDQDEWTIYRFPLNLSLFNDDGDDIEFYNALQIGKTTENPSTINCTVIYLNSCLSNGKCSEYCESMGSNSFRWFHDGCCECIGSNCINYGINKSHCVKCPEVEDESDEEYANNEELWDYGEENDMHY